MGNSGRAAPVGRSTRDSSSGPTSSWQRYTVPVAVAVAVTVTVTVTVAVTVTRTVLFTVFLRSLLQPLSPVTCDSVLLWPGWQVFTNSEMYARVCVGILMHHFAALLENNTDPSAPASDAAGPPSPRATALGAQQAQNPHSMWAPCRWPGPLCYFWGLLPPLCRHSVPAGGERADTQACGQGLLMRLLEAGGEWRAAGRVRFEP